MNILSVRSGAFALLLLLRFSTHAQCLYTLEMLDSYGDGWNGGILTITVNGTPASYTLDNVNDDGIDSTLSFAVVDGAPLVLTYVSGGFPGEVSFNIYNNAGDPFYSSIFPATGTLLNSTGACVSCGPPLSFAVENIWDNRAKLRWQSNNFGTSPALNWRVVYGPKGFVPGVGQGDTLDVAIPKVTITGLQKKTQYDAYVEQYCDVAGGYSKLVGPLSFETYWTNDVAVSGVIAPLSDCDLGMDSLKVTLSNFGAAPQSLFVLRYAVNGQAAPVVPPADGFYTGILGKDSSVVFTFETLTDFSAPGEYRIDVYTELSGDEALENDTFTYYLNSRLQPEYFQQFEAWNGGWTSSGQNPSWEFGVPNKPTVPAAASGLNAWVTSLTGSYNQSELSYLESPCFDFSEQDQDPAFECSITYSMIQDFDGAWLEMSLDGGQNWEKVGEIGEGQNWYNGEIEFLGLSDAWSGNSNGWLKVHHSLPNTAGESSVHLRFVLATSPFFIQEGFGVDDVHIFPATAKDLAGLSVNTLGAEAECGLETDQITFSFINLGYQTQSGIKIGYSINGSAPVVQNVPGNLATDLSLVQTFNIPFDSQNQDFEIKCWTILNGDLNVSNDTITYFVSHAPDPLPFHENFEGLGAPPTDWTYFPSFGFSVTNAHNNISKVLAFNLYSGSTEFTADMPRMGNVQAGDSLYFSYRITNFASQGQTPTVLQNGSKIDIQVSTDCGDTYQTINSITTFNHTPTIALRVRKISLDAFVGQAIKIRFAGTWGASDFWFDLDNINLLSCAGDMALTTELTPASPGVSDGVATVNVGLGNPPYTYNWSNGATGETATGLAAGAYTVSVLDAFGCSDEISFNLGSSGTETLEHFAQIVLAPNPTSGLTTLRANLDHAMDLQIEVLNPIGQRLWSTSVQGSETLMQTIDLSNYSSGLYLLRISGEGKTMTKKLVKE